MISLGAEGELGYPLKKCKELHATQNSSLSFCTEPVKGFNFENNASIQKSNSHTGSHKGNWTFFCFVFISCLWFSKKKNLQTTIWPFWKATFWSFSISVWSPTRLLPELYMDDKFG